jgi:UDP-2,3-diacylglucosamine pyrophosphatase LpxH
VGGCLNTLFIGDLHFPFVHPKYLSFCLKVQDKYECDNVVFGGDLIDAYSWSRYPKDADSFSPSQEFELAYEELQLWQQKFPVAKVVLGNHDTRPIKAANQVMLLPQFFKKFEDIWGIKKWKCFDELNLTVNGKFVKVIHGDGLTGQNACNLALNKYNCNIIFAHLHSVAGIEYRQTAHNLIFAMSIGCGVDKTSVAMRYAQLNKNAQILSCAVLDSYCVPHIIPMGGV